MPPTNPRYWISRVYRALILPADRLAAAPGFLTEKILRNRFLVMFIREFYIPNEKSSASRSRNLGTALRDRIDYIRDICSKSIATCRLCIRPAPIIHLCQLREIFLSNCLFVHAVRTKSSDDQPKPDLSKFLKFRLKFK